MGKAYCELTLAFLPSSLTRNHLFALVYSTYPPVSDSGTVSYNIILDGFLGDALCRISRSLRKEIFALIWIVLIKELERGFTCALSSKSEREIQ